MNTETSIISSPSSSRNTILLVIVAALGYFVDIYDLILFAIVRVQSLKDIGVPDTALRHLGEYVMNMQMGGLLLGGIVWGIIGDKFGRIKVLFGSILLYSIANFANGFVHDIHTYAVIRFIAGVGLAGELGAGITLVSESMHKDKRGYGTMIVASLGLMGAVAANMVAHHFDWRTAYIVGGGLGFVLLLLRVGTFESGMYQKLEHSGVSRGSFKILLGNKKRMFRYANCILAGIPLWFVLGILVTQSPEIGKELGALTVLNAGMGIMYFYIGISMGDIAAGLLSQVLKKRKLTIALFQVLSFTSVLVFLNFKGISQLQFEWLSFAMGIGVGYWATYLTMASEQFGTNIRATVTTTVPNFVRGALIPATFLYEFFVRKYGLITAGYIVMTILTCIALLALSGLRESFGKDLNYFEEDL